MSEQLLDSISTAIEAAGPTPRQRLDAFIAASFSPLLFDRDVLGVWVVFWGMVLHSPRMGAAQQREYGDYVAIVERLIADLAAAEGFSVADSRRAAMALTALLDGLWLAWCLNPAAFSPEDGAAQCHHWIEGLRRGAYG